MLLGITVMARINKDKFKTALVILQGIANGQKVKSDVVLLNGLTRELVDKYFIVFLQKGVIKQRKSNDQRGAGVIYVYSLTDYGTELLMDLNVLINKYDWLNNL